jgi:dihydroorotate dehydrogenase (fumarate)
VKLAPYFTSMPHMAAELVGAARRRPRALQSLSTHRTSTSPRFACTRSLPLSTAAELPLTLAHVDRLLSRTRRVLAGRQPRRRVGDEVVKYLLVGADVVMTASALLRHGPEYLGTMKDGLERWLAEQRVDSLDAVRGLWDATRVENPDAFFRAQYVASLTEYVPGKLVQ